jgi:protein-S-isoprenylcysteine O-methyltransferase Ste14
VAIQLGLLALVLLGPRSFGDAEGGGWPPPWGFAAMVAGLALGVCGGLLALDGALRMGSRLTPSPRPRENARLLVHGSFRLVRHPMYGGLILMAFGWALFVNGPLTLLYACVLFVWLDVKSRFEERLLEERFEGYAEYRRRSRKLVPFVY